MICEHLKQLYQLCLDQQIRLSGTDLIHVVCRQCGQQEICPSNLVQYFDDDEEQKSDTTVESGDSA